MKIARQFPVLVLLVLIGVFATACSTESTEAEGKAPSASDLISGSPQQVPVPDMVTMVDIGAHECIPCKMMTPIIEELSVEYEGRAAIAFIDVWKHKEQAAKFGISSIPTQIFYDAKGQEQFRHVGFLSKEAIVSTLAKLGVE
ncbi:thioredoxin domain-containing protein [Pseudodesulfovibrio sp. zrk46]|uniref:thioredoxin family protein n=1 Tax=Pseudodesulfovibrio sp. zrk46 TaxID=2725288 RepID=UPI001FFD464C|nr:thioredoxin domain-containing protein [Pseudodesulfovibrio sp. zrk46]